MTGPQRTRNPPIVACPVCGKESRYSPENRSRPFCSERCRTIDLGAWAREDYVIAGQGAAEPPEEPQSSG